MWRGVTLAVLAVGGAAPAFLTAAGQELKVTGQASLVGSALDEESPLAPASDGVLADVTVTVTHSEVHESGFTLTWRGEARIQKDAEARPWFAGVLGGCPASDPACPRVAGGGGFLSPVSPATGISAGGGPVEEDLFATLEGASVALTTPWGEGVLGLDAGAASRLDARAPTVLQRVSAFSSSLDPSGLVTTRAKNDVTGPSAKATYLSPRWLGLRLGVSWTPEANWRSADFDPDFAGPGRARAELENVWEGAVSFARQFADQGLRVRAAVTGSFAESSNLAGFGDYEAWGAGLELQKDNWTGGLRWLSSDNGWQAGNGDYEAWEVGLVRDAGKWRFGVEAGWSEDGLNRVEGASWLVGASRKVNDNVRIGVAWMDGQADLPVAVASGFRHENARNDGLLVELSVGNW